MSVWNTVFGCFFLLFGMLSLISAGMSKYSGKVRGWGFIPLFLGTGMFLGAGNGFRKADFDIVHNGDSPAPVSGYESEVGKETRVVTFNRVIIFNIIGGLVGVGIGGWLIYGQLGS